MRYSKLYELLASRAVAQGGLDIEAFVSQAVESGMSMNQVQATLLRDLDNNGPIFGRFFRQLAGAAEQTVLAAERQGQIAGTIDADAELRRTFRLAGRKSNIFSDDGSNFLDDAVDSADPDALAAAEDLTADDMQLTWVATLRNTCHICLPLHGVTKSLTEWRELGLEPGMVHANEGWSSPCYCRWVTEEFAKKTTDLAEPLQRNRIDKISKRTTRGIASTDLAKAQAARDKAMDTPAGRRALRLLGMAREDDTARAKGQRRNAFSDGDARWKTESVAANPPADE